MLLITRIFCISVFLYTSCCFAQEDSFPYHRSKRDYVFVSVGLLAEVTDQAIKNKKAHNLTLSEIEALDRHSINSLDRIATYNWSISAQNFSDVPIKVLPLLPIALVVPQLKNKKWNNAATLGVMFIETSLFTKAITGITKSLVGRTRPYLYNTDFTASERFQLQGDKAPIASTSFFSGHSSTVFASAVFLSKTFTDIYGKNVWSKIIWGSTLTVATATAFARVKAGVHFPTDVMAGAVVGSTIGLMVPLLHKTHSENLGYMVTPNGFYLSLKL